MRIYIHYTYLYKAFLHKFSGWFWAIRMCLIYLTQSQTHVTASLCYTITLMSCHDYRLNIKMQKTMKRDSLKNPFFFWILNRILMLWYILKQGCLICVNKGISYSCTQFQTASISRLYKNEGLLSLH